MKKIGVIGICAAVCLLTLPPAAALEEAQFLARYEAEQAVLADAPGSENAVKADTETDISGGGYVRYFADPGDKITFTVDAPQAGDYQIAVRYAAGDPQPAQMVLLVNGRTQDAAFTPTAGWVPVAQQVFSVTLQKGSNTVAFENTQQRHSKVNFDFIDLYTLGEINWFQNPVSNSPDPYIMRHTDGYYYYCTGGGSGITVRRSKDMTKPAAETVASYSVADKTYRLNGQDMQLEAIWAPEVHYLYDGTADAWKWYIYFCAQMKPPGGAVAGDSRRMFVLESADGKTYEMKARLFSGNRDLWGIDATVLQTEDHSLYYIWSANGDSGRGKSQNLYISAMVNPYTLAGDAVLLSLPSYEWETRWGSGPGSYIDEGPQVFRSENGTYHIIFSGSGSWCTDYCLGVLTCTDETRMLDASAWVKTGPALSKYRYGKGQVSESKSIGHASYTKSAGGEDWVFYHARSAADNENTWTGRRARLGRIWTADNGLPLMGFPIPREEKIPLPDSGGRTLRHGWGSACTGAPETGGWTVTDGETLSVDASGGSAAVYYYNACWETYSFETEASGERGQFGVAACYIDGDNYLYALADPTGRFVTYGKAAGADLPRQESKIEAKNQYHIKVEKGPDGFLFYIDGVPVQQRQADLWKGQPGLLAHSAGKVEFRQVRQDNNMGWGNAADALAVGAWAVSAGETRDAAGNITHGAGAVQTALGDSAGLQKQLFRAMPQDTGLAYTLEATLQELQRGGSLSKYGVYPYYLDQDNFVLVYLNPADRRVDICVRKNGLGGWQQSLPLPEGFQAADENRIAVQVARGVIRVQLNGQELGHLRTNLDQAPKFVGAASVDCRFAVRDFVVKGGGSGA